MRVPVKLNRRGWPLAMGRLPIVGDDPRALVDPRSIDPLAFSRSLSVLKFGTTFKTTHPGRHVGANRAIMALVGDLRPVVLDIGASDGSTSLDLLAELGQGFDTYYVTDYNVEAQYGRDESGALFFRDLGASSVLRATDRLIVYSDLTGAPAPLAWLARFLLRGQRKVVAWEKLSLFQPDVLRRAREDPRVVVARYDMFEPWTQRRPTVVKIANVLNRAYFSSADIAKVVALQHQVLDDRGLLVIVENRGNLERASIYRRRSTGFEVVSTIGGGCEAHDLVAALAVAEPAAEPR